MKSFFFVVAISAFVMANAIPVPKEEPETKQFDTLGSMAGSLMPSTPSTLGIGMQIASAVVSALSTGNPIEDAQRLYKLYKAYQAITEFLHTINPMTYLPSSSDAMVDLENLASNIPSVPSGISNMIPQMPSVPAGRQFVRPPFSAPQFPQILPFPPPQLQPFPPPQLQPFPPISYEQIQFFLNQLQTPPKAPQDGDENPQTKFIPINLPLFPLLENETFRKIICLLDSLNPFNNQKLDICFDDDNEDEVAPEEPTPEEGGEGDAPADGDDTATGDDTDADGDDEAADGGDDADADGDDADADGDDAAPADEEDPPTDETRRQSVEEVVTEDRPPRPNRVSLTPERLQELLGLLGELTQNGGGLPGLPSLPGLPNIFG